MRPDAPWCPWNIEFIRRINGLGDVEDVRRTVFDATYLVLGLGDVYLGAPLATPVDPRHRLVTTKYNPARTWTADSTVGIGGAYLCIYGMESPGGYQLVGRTLQIWNSHRHHPPFEPGIPWLLRFFDRIHWHPVSAEELLDVRADFAAGRLEVRVEPGVFRLREYEEMLEREADFHRRVPGAPVHRFRGGARRLGCGRGVRAAGGCRPPRGDPGTRDSGPAERLTREGAHDLQRLEGRGAAG